MRTLTTAAAAKFDQREGVNPILVVEMTWPTYGVAYYGARTVLIGTHLIQGRLADISNIRSSVGSDLRGTTAAVSVTMLDGDSHFATRIKVDQIESVPVRVMLYEGSLTTSDAVELYSGRVGSPVSYDADTRHLRFDIVSGVTSDEIAYTPDSDSGITGILHEDADGKPWPIILGSARDVPCPLVVRGPRTVLSHDIDSSDTSFEVEDADDFSSGTIDIVVDGELMRGSFSGDTFDVSSRNRTFYYATTDNRTAGNDYLNPFVLWVQNGSTMQLAGKYAVIANVPGNPAGGADPTRVNFCVAQKGNKCVFEKPWTKNGADYWEVPGSIDVEFRRYAWQTMDDADAFGDNANAWTTKAGADITEWGNDTDKYVVSSEPLDSASDVLRVAAFRQHQTNYAGLEKRTLVPVPPSYYEVTASNATFAPSSGLTPTTLKFNPALDLRSQGWETDTIYVCATGSVGGNTVDQIEWIINNGTNLTPDATTFAAVRTKVDDYRSDCAILDGGDALQVASDLAFQARCALTVSGSTVKIHYLSEAPTSAEISLNSSIIRQDSVVEEHSDTDDVWTEVIGQWEKWYSHDAQGKEPKKVRRKANSDLFGKHEETIHFWGYQHKAWVAKSTEFWLQRKAYIWRLFRCQTYLRGSLRLEPWDVVEVNHASFGTTVYGWVQEWDFDPKKRVISLKVWTPIESGSTTVSTEAYLDDSGDSKNPNPNTKIKAGRSEFASVTPLPFSMASEAMQDGSRVLFEITRFVSSTPVTWSGGTKYEVRYVIDVYPRGFAYAASGSAHMMWFGSVAGSSADVGTRGGCARAPGGFYIAVDV